MQNLFSIRKTLLTLISICCITFLNAQVIYWVGGSGNINDPAHWSFTSGGKGGAKRPSSIDKLVFDSKSFRSMSVITITGNPECKSIYIENIPSDVFFQGWANESLTVYENFSINSSINWDFEGRIHFKGNTDSKMNTSVNRIKSSLLIEKSNARLFLENSVSLVNEGSLLLSSGELVADNKSVFCNDLIKINSREFTLRTKNFLIHTKGKVELNSKFIDASNNTEIEYAQNDPLKDFVNESDFPNLIFSSNNSAMRMPATATVVDSATCNGDCDGSVLVTFSGPGTAPYTITFTAGTVSTFPGVLSSPFLATNLCAGNYTVRVFNSSNQQIGSAANVLVYEPSVIAVNFNQFTNPSCFGDCTGQILFDIIGGNPKYTAVWQPANITLNGLNSSQEDSVENLCNGFQRVNISDRKGCTGIDSFLIIQPTPLIPNGGFSNQLCFGNCDGRVFVSPSGGTPFSVQQGNGIFYQIVWDNNPALTNDTLYNQCPGVHSVTITDANGCDTTITLTVNPNSQLSFTTVSNLSLSCFDNCNGSAQINNVSGGAAPYTFSWSGPTNPTVSGTATSSSATGLCVGIYSCTISDANGCDSVVTFSISSPALLVATVTPDDPDCNLGTNGSASASAIGGTGNISFSWYNTSSPPPGASFASGATASNLTAGSYTLIAVDANNCNDTVTFLINQPPPLTVNISSTPPQCFGQSNGSATATANGGTPIPPANTYTYSWNSSPVQNSQTATNLPAGSYTVTVTDNNNCSQTQSVILNSPSQINNNLITTPPTCFGNCDGTATSNPTGGSGSGYTFNWSCAGSTSNTVSSLCAGACVLTVTDGAGCQRISNFNLIQPNPLTLALTATPLNCAGASTAQISSIVNGGTPGYSFCWNPPTCSATTPGLSNVGAGVYVLQVTDSRACSQTAQVTIVSPAPISINLTATNPSCFGGTNGSITNIVNGGTPNYSFLWLPINSTSQNPPLGTLAEGTYTVNVTDALGCSASQTIQLEDPDPIVVSADSIPTSCVGQCNGSAIATANGGNSGGYTFSWSSVPVQNSFTASNLCIGTYTVTVTDPLGCTGTGITQVTQPLALTVSVTNIVASCNICNGSATLSGNGGTAPYSFTVDGNITTSNAVNLCAGTHTVVITDANNCTSTSTFIVPTQVSITVDATASLLTCNGDCNGVANAIVNGATGQVNFLWTSPSPTNPTTQSTQTATGLCAGIHTITVTDQLGCSSSETVTFANPPLLTVTSVSTPVACSGASIGTASVTPSGGVAPVNVVWSNGATGNSINNLGPGTYTATISDANGCTLSETVNISTAPTLTVTINSTPPSGCLIADGTISVGVAGGSGSFTFSWSNPPGGNTNVISNISAGTYTVTITDAITGCDTVIPIGLSDPAGPVTSQSSSGATCNALCNGTGTVNVVSGVSPVVISWPNGGPSGPSPQTQSSLCAGIYPVEIEDANGCISIETINISQPDEFQENVIVTSPQCNGTSSGSIVFSPLGGTAPFTYTINSNPDDSSMTGLAAGTYTILVSDAANCQSTFTYDLIDSPILHADVSSVNIGCNGPQSGSATALPSGGTLPYTQQWISSSGISGTGLTISNLSVGTYTLQILDANNCVDDTVFSISQNPVLIANFSSTNNLCSNGCTGTAEFQPVGGSGNYSFNWNTNPAQTTATISSLCPGIYTGSLSDDAGCSIVQTFTVLPASSITISTSSTDPLCNGDCNGTATAIANGGTGNLSFSWSPNVSNTSTATNLCSGAYIVTVSDQNNCSNSQVVTLTDPSILQSNVIPVEPTCFGDCDGILVSTPIGGTLPYSFNWQAGLSTNDSLSNACSGDFTVVVTDGNGCRDTTEITLNQPPQVSLSASTSPSTCGACDGSITVNNIIGTTLTWLAPLSGNQLSQTNLCAGIYQAIVSDANNCSDTVEFAISNSNGPLVNVDTLDVSCFGLCDGSATVVSVSGLSPFTYSWNQPITGNDSIVNGLCAGNYISGVTDNNACITFTNFTVNEPDEINVSAQVTDATCLGLNDGIITLLTSGGTPAYSFSWNNSAPDSLAAINLAPGSYAVTISDVNSCIAQFNFTVGSSSQINYDASITGITCFGNCTGQIELNNISGGISPYSVLWNDPIGQSGFIANNLCSGSIGGTITDSQGCIVTIDTLISTVNDLSFNPFITPATCGQCDGSISLVPSGGTAPFTYLWSNGESDSIATSLCAGVYMVQINDAAGCLYQTNIPLSNSNGPQITVSVTNETCFTSCDASASVSIQSGNGPFLFNWLPSGQNTDSVSNLCSGTYFIQVRDADNCLTTDTVEIDGPQPILPNQSVVTSNCGACDGQITLNPSGGSTGNYSFAWSAGLPPSSTQSNLCAGVYTVTITDGNGCSDSSIVALNSTDGPLLTITTDSTECDGSSNGSATVAILGNNSPFSIVWSNGSVANPTTTNLPAGNYAVTVTDALNCVSNQFFQIHQPNPIGFSLAASQLPDCQGVCNGSIQALPIGGTLNYSFLWSNGLGTSNTVSNLCAGSYSLTVTDANGCIASQSSIIGNNPQPFSTASVLISPTCNECNGSISLNITGGLAPYGLIWTTGDTLSSIDSICAGVYQVLITDENGCEQTNSFPVSNADGITGENITIQDESCFQSCDGAGTISAIGGTPPITYQWLNDNSTAQTQTNLCAGTYFVLMSDSNLCVRTAQINIQSPSQMQIIPNIVQPTCNASNGSISFSGVSGGNGPYSFSWSPPVAGNTSFANGLAPGNYSVTISDNSSPVCSQTFTLALSSDAAPVITDSIIPTSCFGTCDGEVFISVSSILNTTLLWSTGSTSNQISNLCEGNYSVTVTDAAGCIAVQNYFVSSPDTLQFSSVLSTDPTCNGLCNGSATVLPFGGTLPYNYTWSGNSSTTFTSDSICAGSETITITDANNCSVDQNINLSQPDSINAFGIVTNTPCSSLSNGAIDLQVSGGVPAYAYLWNGNASDTTQDLNSLPIGNYSVLITDANNCIDSLSFSVFASDTVLANAGLDSVLCDIDSLALDGTNSFSNSGGLEFAWTIINTPDTIGLDSIEIIDPVPGTLTYLLTVTNSNGCSDRDTIELTINPLPNVDAGPDTSVISGQSIQIGGNPTGPASASYLWSPSLALNDSLIANPVSSTTITTTYVVMVVDQNGCTASDTMNLRIDPEIFIPNGISPNSDGKNDFWVIDNIERFPDNEVEIYNRWGELLYLKKSYDNKWDGTYNGKPLPIGTYYYVLKLNDPQFPDPYTGPLTIFK